MPLIVIVEDDAGNLQLLAAILKKDGHEVLLAVDGAQGLRLVEQYRPDLIISDVQMPNMNGFQMLSALRQNPDIAATPVILLTSLQERAHMRIGMTTGADDYLTKPFRPGELRDAVNAQINKRVIQAQAQTLVVNTAVQTALADQKDALSQLYEQRLTHELGDRWPTAQAAPGDEQFAMATVLFVDILSPGLTEKLSSAELSELVKRVYSSAGDTVYLFGAHHVQMIGEGVLAIFVDSADTVSVTHGLRAVRAAFGLVGSVGRARHYLETRYADRKLPSLEVGVALHNGPVTIAHMRDPLLGGPTLVLPVGDTVSVTLLLQKQARISGWHVAATASVLKSIPGAVKLGRRALVQLPGRSAALETAEILSLTE